MVFFLALSFSPVVVYIYQRVGFRWCMIITSVVFGFSVCVTPFMTNLNIVFFTFSIPFGIATSFLFTLTVTSQREYFDKYFGFAVGVRYCGNSLGSVVLSFILPIILAELGYKMTFLSLLAIVPIILCYGFVARHHVPKDTDIRKRNGKSVILIYKELLRDKSFAISVCALTIFFFPCYLPLVFMVNTDKMFGFLCTAINGFKHFFASSTLLGSDCTLYCSQNISHQRDNIYPIIWIWKS